MTIDNIKLAAIGGAIYIAGVVMLCATPAHALGEAEAWQRYIQMQQLQPQQPALRQWNPPPPVPNYDFNLAPRLHTTCYLVGNIITCN